MPSWDEMNPMEKALVTLGMIAGVLWGGTVGAMQSAEAMWGGMIVGLLLGSIAGWVASVALNTALGIIALLIELALILLPVLRLLDRLSS